jgi:hypothetical protein
MMMGKKKTGSEPALKTNDWLARIGRTYPKTPDNAEMDAIAEALVNGSSVAKSFVPSGYAVKPGERVLLAINSFYDSTVVDAIARAIIKAGATVDVISIDMGPERQLEDIDELKGFMHNWPGIEEENEIRKWPERVKWVERIAGEEKYDLLIHGVGQPPVQTTFRSDTIPWTCGEIFPSARFPREIWDAIEASSWNLIWNKGRGGKARVTDREGTDISFTLFEEYYDLDRYKDAKCFPFFNEKPVFGHLFARPTPPLYAGKVDATGVVAGTTNHFSCPYPTIKIYVEGGKVVSVEGGGKYGDAWRAGLELTKDIHYPLYPDKGLFWWWELGIGTNPKMSRPSNAFLLSGCGTTIERLRSGVTHFGFGTLPMSPSEQWAREKGLPYGHLHVHLLNCTYEITCKDGTKIKVIDKGHLTSLDDPEVIKVAAKYGDPKTLLKEDWVAPIPGITEPGDYLKDYAPNPLAWLLEHEKI